VHDAVRGIQGGIGFLNPIQSTLSIRRFIMIKKFFMLLLTALYMAGVAATLAGCNTVEGAGKDIEKGGKAIKEEASEHK
jgi:predicted small secreted protein